MWKIQWNVWTNKLKTSAFRKYCSQAYHLLDRLVTVPDKEKVKRNIQFKMVGLPPLIRQKIVYIKRYFDAYLSPFFCNQYTLLLKIQIYKLDHTLQFNNNHLLFQTIEWNNINKNIKIRASNNGSSLPYYLLHWLVTLP